MSYIVHYGTKGMKKGVRRWTNDDGTLNEAGKARYRNKGVVYQPLGGGAYMTGYSPGAINYSPLAESEKDRSRHRKDIVKYSNLYAQYAPEAQKIVRKKTEDKKRTSTNKGGSHSTKPGQKSKKEEENLDRLVKRRLKKETWSEQMREIGRKEKAKFVSDTSKKGRKATISAINKAKRLVSSSLGTKKRKTTPSYTNSDVLIKKKKKKNLFSNVFKG